MATNNDIWCQHLEQENEQLQLQLIMVGKHINEEHAKFTNVQLITDGNEDKKITKNSRQIFNAASEESLNITQKFRDPSINNELIDSGTLKITIKSKTMPESVESNYEIMKLIMNSFYIYTARAKRLKTLKDKVYRNTINRRLQLYFDAWKIIVQNTKQFTAKNMEISQHDDVKKIQLFFNAIAEKQKNLEKIKINRLAKSEPVNKLENVIIENTKCHNILTKNISNINVIRKNRIEVQKKIITEQRIKLTQQNRIIQEMKLMQYQVKSNNSLVETLNTVKTVVNNCKQDNYCQASLCPPKFLMTMEARSIARNERVKQFEIKRKIKLEEKKNKLESIKLKAQAIQKQQQIEKQRQATLKREKIERTRILTAERMNNINRLADNYYRKYLLHNYIVKPLAVLIQINRNSVIKASRHYNINWMKKLFNIWKNQIKYQIMLKYELSASLYNKNILTRIFHYWIKLTKDIICKTQVACDFYDLWLQEKFFKILITITTMARLKNNTNEKLAIKHNEKIQCEKYFIRWRKYMKISDKIKESDECREQWRHLVQTVIPDFAPKYRGVLIDY